MQRHVPMIALMISALVSCTTTPSLPPDFTVDDQYGDDVIEIALTKIEQSMGSVKGIVVEIRNNSSNPVTVVWERSSIDDLGGSHPVFLSGTSYRDAGFGAPRNRKIPAGSSFSTGIYPADQVAEIGSSWHLLGMFKGPISATICILVDGAERSYTVRTGTTVSQRPPSGEEAGEDATPEPTRPD